MTRRTHGIRTVVTMSFALLLLTVLLAAGCTQEERKTTATSAAQVAAASVTTTAMGQSTTTTRRSSSGIKPNGRGGIDASEAQKNALARMHYIRDHHNEAMKVFRPSTQPTTRPATSILSH